MTARSAHTRRSRRGRPRPRRCANHLIAAPLWPMHGVNLGTLLRTCDAVGACMAVPRLPWVPEALEKGNTLRHPACVHWTGRDVETWLDVQDDASLVGIELADGATRIGDLRAARRRTIVVLGHERDGIPVSVLTRLDQVIEIPMLGSGRSLNVAVAGSLALYRLAGLL